MLCKLYLEEILNFQCEHSFSKLKAPQLMSNSKRSAATFILIQLMMFRQRKQMTVLVILNPNARVRYFFNSDSLIKLTNSGWVFRDLPIRVNCMSKHSFDRFENFLQDGHMMVNVSEIARTEYSMVRSMARPPWLLPCALIFVRLMVLPFLESKVGTSAIVVTMRQQKIPSLMTNAQHRVMGMHLKLVFVVVIGQSISSLSLKLFLKSSTKNLSLLWVKIND